MAESRLKPCPDSPNCVCSRGDAGDAVHYVAPLTLAGDPSAAMARLRGAIEAADRAEIVESNSDYLRAVFTSRLMRFKDDVEFELDTGAGVIHVRSASRVGYGDMGANRKRIEAIRRSLSPG